MRQKVLGNPDLVSQVRGPLQHSLLGATLAYQEKTNALEQIGWRVHSPGEEHISFRIVSIRAHSAGNQNRGRVRRKVLHRGDELRPVQSRHGHVGNNQVNTTPFEAFQGLFAAGTTHDAVASRFQHDLTVRKGLLVVVDT